MKTNGGWKLSSTSVDELAWQFPDWTDPRGGTHQGGSYSNNGNSSFGINNIDDFMASATKPWGDQGLNELGRALQKHSGRAGSPFENIRFSHQTANQDGMNILNNIMSSQNQIIEVAPRGGFEVFDSITKQGFAVSRNGLFNGFRDLKR